MFTLRLRILVKMRVLPVWTVVVAIIATFCRDAVVVKLFVLF